MITDFNKYIINESRSEYLAWKRKNVSLRGISGDSTDGENNAGARFGSGLYSAALSNRDMAKKYGKVYFLVNAIPKNPKIVNDANLGEMWFQKVINIYCKEHGKEYDTIYFFKNTTIKDAMLDLGYDGFVIKGREYVNYKPENVIYFEHEYQLENYYNNKISQRK